MNDLSVTIKDDFDKDCYIEDILIFQKHLNDAVFTLDDSLRKKVDQLVKKSSSED